MFTRRTLVVFSLVLIALLVAVPVVWNKMHVTDTPASASASTKGDIAFGGTPGHTGEQPGPEVVGNVNARWSEGIQEHQAFAPIVADGRVFVTFLVAQDNNMITSAYDAVNGDELWSSFDNDFQGGGLAYSGGSLFVGGYDGVLRAVNPATGAVIWTQSIAQTTNGPIFWPIAVNGMVYTNIGSIVAWDAKTGKESWHQDYPSDAGYAASPEMAVADGRVVVTASTVVFALDAESGEQAWTQSLPGPTSLVAGDGIVAGCDAEHSELFGLDGKTGQQLWSASLDECTAPVLSNGQLYATTSNGTALLDTRSGKQQSTLIGTDRSTCGLALADQTLYVCSSNGVQGYEARPGGTRVFQYYFDADHADSVWGPPVVAESALFIMVFLNIDRGVNVLYSLGVGMPPTPAPTIAPTQPPLPAAAANCLSPTQMWDIPVGATVCMVGEVAEGYGGDDDTGWIGVRDLGSNDFYGQYSIDFYLDQYHCLQDNHVLQSGQVVMVSGIAGSGRSSSETGPGGIQVDDLTQVQIIRPGESTPVPLGTENSECNGSNKSADGAAGQQSLSQSTAFAPGERVTVSVSDADGLNVRTSPGGDSSTIIGYPLFDGTHLTIVAGPKEVDGDTWYQVSLAAGTTGWVLGKYLSAA